MAGGRNCGIGCNGDKQKPVDLSHMAAFCKPAQDATLQDTLDCKLAPFPGAATRNDDNPKLTIGPTPTQVAIQELFHSKKSWQSASPQEDGTIARFTTVTSKGKKEKVTADSICPIVGF